MIPVLIVGASYRHTCDFGPLEAKIGKFPPPLERARFEPFCLPPPEGRGAFCLPPPRGTKSAPLDTALHASATPRLVFLGQAPGAKAIKAKATAFYAAISGKKKLKKLVPPLPFIRPGRRWH